MMLKDKKNGIGDRAGNSGLRSGEHTGRSFEEIIAEQGENETILEKGDDSAIDEDVDVLGVD